MPLISKLSFRRGKKAQGNSQVPELQQVNLGTSQPSSSTFSSAFSSNSWNSHIGNLSSGGNSNRSLSGFSPPAYQTLHTVPENADFYHIPAEMDGHSYCNRTSVPALPSQAPGLQQDRHSLVFEELIQMEEPVMANNAVTSVDTERKILNREENASADNVRWLRELIRERYGLDLYVWSKRRVKRANREDIEPKCKKADHILQQIYWIVNAWEQHDFSDDEWEIVERIKACLFNRQLENGQSNEPAYWDSLKPWERVDETDTMSRHRF